jgi:hypothetical protein
MNAKTKEIYSMMTSREKKLFDIHKDCIKTIDDIRPESKPPRYDGHVLTDIYKTVGDNNMKEFDLSALEIIAIDGLAGRKVEEGKNLIRDILEFRFPETEHFIWMKSQDKFTAKDVSDKFDIPHGSTICHYYETKGFIEVVGSFIDKSIKSAKPQKIYSVVR